MTYYWILVGLLAIVLVGVGLVGLDLGATGVPCFWISLATLVFTLVGFEIYACIINRIGSRMRVVDLVPHIRGAAAMGLGGSRMRIEKPGSTLFIDFEKVVPVSGPEALRMVVYSDSCSESEFGGAQNALRSLGIDFRICADARGREQLVVECGLDVEIAARAARAVLIEAWGLDFEERVRVWHKGSFHYRPEKLKSVS